MTSLLEAVHRYARKHCDESGVARMPIRGLTVLRANSPSGLIYDITRPLACFVVQGSKQVTMGTRTVSFTAGDSLVVAADVPTVSRITRASAARPYLSLVLDLDAAVIADLSGQMGPASQARMHAVSAEVTDAEVEDAALRLMRLISRPEALPLLQAPLMRELHYWLLAGKHGAAIRRLGWPEGDVQRVARAVAVLRARFAEVLSVKRLAATAGMSPSSFHQHFRAVTSLSPLQFQKQLRLIEARRLMQSEGASATLAASTVGYESVPQFTREYRRMFGVPPVRDARSVKRQTSTAQQAAAAA